MKRVSTGDPQLDKVLSGGMPSHSINVLMGEPGVGKTILAQQMTFANEVADRPVLYVSTLSEPLTKFIAHMQTLSFADSEKVGHSVVFEDIGEALVQKPEALVEYFVHLIQEYRPQIIVVDSFKAIADLMPDMAAWRRELFKLVSLFSSYDCTVFLVGEYTLDMIARLPEFAVADGVIHLRRAAEESRHDQRMLRVLKLRGSEFLPGEHAYRVDAEGVHVFPRLVTPALPPDYSVQVDRVKTGITGLDSMIESGWLKGTTTLVAGPSGAGKTVLGLHFLRQGTLEGERCLLVSFQENPVQMERMMRNFGWQAESLLRPEQIELFYTSPVELHVDTIVQHIFDQVLNNGVQRLLIDALGDLSSATSNRQRFRDYVYSLSQFLTSRNVTTMLNMEAGNRTPRGEITGEDISYLADNVVSLEMKFGAVLERTIRITKSRGSAHDGHEHVLRITGNGIVVE